MHFILHRPKDKKDKTIGPTTTEEDRKKTFEGKKI
jgi:hypothetical protein